MTFIQVADRLIEATEKVKKDYAETGEENDALREELRLAFRAYGEFVQDNYPDNWLDFIPKWLHEEAVSETC